MGWLTRKAGLSCDNLVSVELVKADGAVVRASAEQNPELFWAVRGWGQLRGGHALRVPAARVGPTVQIALSFWDLDDGPEAFRAARDQVPQLPDDIAVFMAGLKPRLRPWCPRTTRGPRLRSPVGRAWASRGPRPGCCRPSRGGSPGVCLRHPHPLHPPSTDVRRIGTLGDTRLREGGVPR